MKLLRKVLLGLAMLIAVALIAGLFIANDYHVERTVTISQPNEKVFGYVKQLRNQNNYSKWALMEPGMKKSFRGTDGTVGFVSAWEGEEVGKGEQEIRGISEGRQIDYEIRFEKPFRSVAELQMSTLALSDDQTKVTWGFTGHAAYPMNVLNGLLARSLGKDLQTGLNNLKGILEHRTTATAGMR